MDIVELDNPQTPEFASWQSYTDFARRVRQSRRYVWGKEEEAFLATVLATRDGRDVDIPEGATLFRAQLGIDWHIRRDENDNALDEEPVGYEPARMTPRAHQATEGRVNPAGIPVLYLARPRRPQFPRSGLGSGQRCPWHSSGSPDRSRRSTCRGAMAKPRSAKSAFVICSRRRRSMPSPSTAPSGSTSTMPSPGR